jgi:hypothetical protein
MRFMVSALLVAGCAGRAPAVKVAAPSPPSSACAAPEFRQFDFWLGDWDLVIRARKAADKDEWVVAHGTQHVESLLGGCAISESFTGDGPGSPWAGKSYSVWQAKLGKWRQTWVDDQGSYLAFTGGLKAGTMTLYGEPFEANGKQVTMRMAFRDVTPGAMRWEWERSLDGGTTWQVALIIEYRRRG